MKGPMSKNKFTSDDDFTKLTTRESKEFEFLMTEYLNPNGGLDDYEQQRLLRTLVKKHISNKLKLEGPSARKTSW